MSKLTDDMKTMTVKESHGSHHRIPDKFRSTHGGPCPLCNGERNVAGYVGMNVQSRQTHKNPSGSRQSKTIIPAASTGACEVCAVRLYREFAARIGRMDRVRQADEWLERNGITQEDAA